MIFSFASSLKSQNQMQANVEMRIFRLICILICAYSIVILIDEKYEVAYSSVNKIEQFDYLVCFGRNESLSQPTEQGLGWSFV